MVCDGEPKHRFLPRSLAAARNDMRFRQIDTITELVPGQRIVALRTLRAEEDYLRDHFPHFPVMPGVMMLEACYQAAMWMVRTGDDFAYPLVLLREAKSVKFADFLAPGETLEIVAETVKEDGPQVVTKVKACKEGRTSVSARLILERQNVADLPQFNVNEDIRTRTKQQFHELFGSQLKAAMSASLA
jgi:3-hydroxyacyl-[acyl-carrier-protein] dehydratase